MKADQSPGSLSRHLARLTDAAQGRTPCDLVLRNARYLDVFSAEWRAGDLAIRDGALVGLEPGLKGLREIDLRGQAVVPGFIDAHVHIESSLLSPRYFDESVLARGTTSAVCDPHELANVEGISGVRYFLEAATRARMDLWVMLSSCVPATRLETNGGGELTAADLAPLLKHGRALGLAEMMNVPGVLGNDADVLAKLEAFAGRPLDGHAPLVRGQALAAYAATGISSCHESSEPEEAREKLRYGISVWIREGSVAKDLDALAPLLTLATSTSIGFCTDDRNPLDIATEGHVDHLIRGAIARGVAPEVAYRSASWTVARHYGLATRARHPDVQGGGWAERFGAIAPGFAADLVVLGDARTCAVQAVYKGGVPIAELPAATSEAARPAVNSLRASVPEAADLRGPAGAVHVIDILAGKIITERSVASHDAPGIARLSVLERYGRGSKPANAYVRGFGTGFRGAIASSVGHDSHNLIVVGGGAQATEDMRAALGALLEVGGGFCVVQAGQVLARLALPFGGLMSDQAPAAVERSLYDLKRASRAVGCELHEPFLQLAFLSLPVIPSLKLTDRGLVDVERFEIISVSAS